MRMRGIGDMGFTWRRGLPALVGLFAIVSLLACRGLFPDTFERARLFVFDTLQRLEPWEATRAEVKIIDIDDQSLKRVGQWPWSRSTLAQLVRNLQDMGAKAIAFDVVFAEPDRTSPALLAREWERAFGWRPAAGASIALPDYDQELAAAFARGRVVTGFGLLAEENGASPTIGASLATIGGDPAATVQNFRGAVPNLAALESAAAGNGGFSIAASRDQVIRRMPMLFAFEGKLAPALALETLRVAEDEDTIKVRAERNGGPSGPVTGYTLRIGDYEAPLDVDGSLLLHHGVEAPQNTIAAWRLLDPDQRSRLAGEIAGHIALIGTSAVGLSDLRATPLNPLEPGVNLHARAIEQIIAHHFLTRPTWAPGAEFVAAALLSAALVMLATYTALRLAILAIGACLVLVVGATWFAFSMTGLLLDPTLIALTTICGTIAASFARYFIAERDAARLRSAFTHYLSPALVDALAREPDRLKLGGEQREMTFLFTDLEGFTSLTEAADPQNIVIWLNAYLDGLCRIAMEHGGTVDKIVGDAVHVMFNAPLDQPDHAERGVRCALAIDAFAERYSSEHKARGIAFGATRIGVNTGPAVVGNFGGSRRFDYTAHGDAINTAARLESANKTLGTRICIARATAEKVSAVAFLPIGTLMLKGKTQGVDVFAPQSEVADAAAWSALYLEAFARMLSGDDAGSTALVALHERYPDHPILALHARRIRAGERSVRMAA
jgi:adenylate cyclase